MPQICCPFPISAYFSSYLARIRKKAVPSAGLEKNMRLRNKIEAVKAREIIDSRGNPTVEAMVVTTAGYVGRAKVPSGASTGAYEALELRDGDDSRFGGKGVLKAVENVNGVISREICGMGISVPAIDKRLLELDGTEDKSALGANAILAVSLAVARAGAASVRMPLYRYLGGVNAVRLPVPMMNVINGGAHAANNLDIQEFMIMPMGFDTYSDALRAGCEVYHALGKLLKSDGKSTGVGDEGGFAPDFTDEREAMSYLCRAIDFAGYDTERIKIALDVAATEWVDGDTYRLPKVGERLTAKELANRFDSLSKEYPVVSIEDPLGEDDFSGWFDITAKLGGRMMLVGDDLFVTNTKRLARGIKEKAANAVLVKPNQIGTLTETMELCRLARESGYGFIISHRSGETSDTTIADLAVALGGGFIKTGAPCRGERVAKYNRLLEIESELGEAAMFGNFSACCCETADMHNIFAK